MDFTQLLFEKRKRWYRAIIAMSTLLLAFSAVYVFAGEVFITPWHEMTGFDRQLILELRAPRLIAAIVIGACLAVSGATLQVLLGNVLAEPGIIGVSGGASVAMVIILFFFPLAATPLVFMLGAIIGAMVFTSILVGIARSMRLTTIRLLLVGVALGILARSVVTWAFYFSTDLSLRQLMYWLMGSIGGVDWSYHLLSLLILPVFIWLILQGSVLDRLMMGEIHAKQLGIDVHRVRWKLIVAVAILVGASVALGGIIGFVGLVVPHLLRLAFGTENRYLLPVSAVAGALLLVFADLISRTALDSAELPLGVVTTTIGAPVFIWMLLKNHDSR
ncbi:vitamin B12 ABC transporter permease BtuC [Vibrio mangrovi]|uniref:Vitamin B12 import system permease protein BtuC n=1 Tax=Vibrio mangrovi TaxID=474394 RepID=A0A1Y6IMS3_9VIBR|nr:vitamin B12 ABC transporter permease BtuC [Vibrio mangrovi]MDW6004232.1 vitamin B12 ABC transporter permease BtuC [Vibrio mangrovi]SMR98969.1 Vitamin B12 import system permease protein BtuC [Vibrio mangrovi]